MRVILNVDAITPPLTGIGRYALQLARGLPADPRVQAVRHYSAYKWVGDPENALRANRTIARIRRYVPAKSLAMQAYFRLRQACFDALAGRRYADWLLHSPNYLLFRHHGPAVATVHDFSWHHYPQFHPVERVRIMEQQMPRTVERAEFLITDSEFVRREAIDLLGVAPERVVTVPLGVDARFSATVGPADREIRTRRGLEGAAYLLSVATLEPRKNLARLIAAYSRLPDSVRHRHPLVLIGVSGWHTREIEQAAAPLERAGQLRRLGYVAEEELPALYRGAHLFAFPSLYEGFGLPPLEAMACGVPVLVSQAGALSEVAGDSALSVPATDVEALCEGLHKGIEDELWRRAARALGPERAAEYTWSDCVRGTVDVYTRAATA